MEKLLTVYRRMRAFATQDLGATAVEYALIAGMISIVILGGVTLLGQSTLNLFDTVANSL